MSRIASYRMFTTGISWRLGAIFPVHKCAHMNANVLGVRQMTFAAKEALPSALPRCASAWPKAKSHQGTTKPGLGPKWPSRELRAEGVRARAERACTRCKRLACLHSSALVSLMNELRRGVKLIGRILEANGTKGLCASSWGLTKTQHAKRCSWANPANGGRRTLAAPL